jgi:hypothetical protein
MITVFDIVTSPNFENFQIISGEKGIQNPVSGTGIFDWESKSDIAKTFRKGEFVITTLSIAKDDFDYANDCIKTLILHGVSAICIKEVFFRNLSEDTIQKSDILGVPIFFFSDTFVDDIVYDVRNLLASDKGELRSNLGPVLKNALQSWYVSGSVQTGARDVIEEKLHPYLSEFTRCVAVIPKKGQSLSTDFHPAKTNSNVQTILLPYDSGMLALFSCPERDGLGDRQIKGLLDAVHVNSQKCWSGSSAVLQGTRQLADSILQAFLACASSAMAAEPNQDDKLEAKQVAGGETQGKPIPAQNDFLHPSTVAELLISNCWTESSRQYFRQKKETMVKYDDEHGSDLLGTLSAYIEANGDLVVASKMLFQHANTVRYRVAKIKSLLEIETPSSYLELYVFVKLMQIYETLEGLFSLKDEKSPT